MLSWDTWKATYNNTKNYIKASPEAKAKADAQFFNSSLTAFGTFAPISEVGGMFNSSLVTAPDGLTFPQFKAAMGGTETLGKIVTSTGEQRISTEFSHMFITQSTQRLYNLPN